MSIKIPGKVLAVAGIKIWRRIKTTDEE